MCCSLLLTRCAATLDCRTVPSHQLRERPASVLVHVIDLVIGFVIYCSSNVWLRRRCRNGWRRVAIVVDLAAAGWSSDGHADGS